MSQVPPPGQEPASGQFGTLVEQHRKPLYRFVLRNIGNPSDAEDISQQAFFEAYRALAGFRGESELSTWLYGIAMNLVRNYLNRAPHRVRRYESDDVLATLPTDEDSPDALMERMQMMHRLYTEIAFLSDELNRSSCWLPSKAIRTRNPHSCWAFRSGTVRSRLFRAREAIKQRLPELRQALLAS